MSSYKPKSLEELNSMYDKALSAQRAIKRGTSKINETNSSESFFDDVIKEAELTVEKEPEKRIADLSVAVDDFIKHFSDADKEKTAPSVSQNQPKPKAPETTKTTEKPKIKVEKKASTIVATPSPAIARKQSGEHISNLMSDYIKIMNDQDDSDEDEPKQRKSFLSRKKEKKGSSKESFREEDNIEEPTYTPLSDEMKEDVFSFDSPVSFDELSEEETPSAASEEAFNAFSAMNKTKEAFHKEIVKEEPEEDAVKEETDEASEETENDENEEKASEVIDETNAEEEREENAADSFDDFSSHSDEEESESDESEEAESEDEEIRPYSKGRNALRVITRVFLSLICAVTLVLSLFCASLSTVFNINTGKEVFGKYYFFTSSHDFVISGVKAGDLVICEKKSSVSDDETAVYIDLENRTFSFGLKDGSITDEDGNIVYLIGEEEIPRDDVLGTVYKSVPLMGDAITLVYKYYVPVIAVFVSLTVILLLVIIFALKKRKADEPDEEDGEEENYEEETTEEENSEDSQEDIDADIFAELD